MVFNSIYYIFIFTELVSSVIVFIVLFLIIAPYGRHFRKGWGITMHERFAWISMEFPAFFIPLLIFILSKRLITSVSIFFLLIWELHYIQRTFVYPLLIPRARKNFPFVIAFSGFAFNFVNGYIQGYHLFVKSNMYSFSWLLDIRFIIGTVVFLCGFVINLLSDKILRELKKNSDGTYNIPYGGMFTFISSPNYFGEIIEWVGWAILTWSLPGLLFALFTIANLLPRAVSHHKWYKNTFPDYPEGRKAIIPFLL
jgi:hypothetical protein